MFDNFIKKFLLIIVFFTITSLFSEDVIENSSSSWSKEQGLMTWLDATSKCKSLGMRVPDVNDFDKAKEEGMLFQFAMYWVSEEHPYNKSKAYTYKIVHRFRGPAFEKDGTQGLYGVKCIQ